MNELVFTQNYNNKLNCHAFTTLRLQNTNRHVLFAEYKIMLGKQHLKNAQLRAIKHIDISQINDYIALLDTGLPAINCVALIKSIYPNVDFSQQKLSFLLFQTTATF